MADTEVGRLPAAPSLVVNQARTGLGPAGDHQLSQEHGLGVPIDLVDKHGNPVHVGDTLRFDAREWGEEHTFVICIRRGEIVMSGTPSDIPDWCEVIRRWDGVPMEVTQANAARRIGRDCQ